MLAGDVRYMPDDGTQPVASVHLLRGSSQTWEVLVPATAEGARVVNPSTCVFAGLTLQETPINFRQVLLAHRKPNLLLCRSSCCLCSTCTFWQSAAGPERFGHFLCDCLCDGGSLCF